jgi:catechol 2,3-dioxygenase-like lactoylglutathione lyase family enzyme
MKLQFLSSVAVITADPAASGRLYVDALGLPLAGDGDGGAGADPDDYRHSEAVAGCRHFGVWPLHQAAEACFGTRDWPAGRTVPQASLEFDVADPAAVQAAADELAAAGYEILHAAREEPWGQTVARLQAPEGTLLGISYAPWMHA